MSLSSRPLVPIVADTREQEPYGFDARRVRVIRRALPAGDYSIEGMEAVVAVERKSLPDFVSTVIHDRPRFYRELERLRGYASAAVIVEGNLMDVLGGRYRSAAHPNALLGTIAAITIDFGIPVFFCSNRQAAARFVEAYLVRIFERTRA
ncbi:MAG: ERCC4 domain-containing protein [Bryobacterales bacterium]|nr:ERCC4 domain-containing protein [Bryobacterales bacterium]